MIDMNYYFVTFSFGNIFFFTCCNTTCFFIHIVNDYEYFELISYYYIFVVLNDHEHLKAQQTLLVRILSVRISTVSYYIFLDHIGT